MSECPIITGDDVRAHWWELQGLIIANAFIVDEPGRDGMAARGSLARTLREEADRFSKIVEALADGQPLPEDRA